MTKSIFSLQSLISLFVLTLLISEHLEADDQSNLNPKKVEFFEKQVRPILVKRCYSCHSVSAEESLKKKAKGNLYLDTKRGWVQGGDSGQAILPGAAESSLAIKAIRYSDANLKMPPDGKLPPHEIKILERWVQEGAVDPRQGKSNPGLPSRIDIEKARKQWPYTKIQKTEPPSTTDSNWPLTSIDRFILKRLEDQNLKPNGDASSTTLVRRLYFDLIGLPPSPDQIQEFENHYSKSPTEAIQTTAETLLASPRFGEHWGRKWLDLARYADTNGSDFNATFYNAWRYRDYVIHAFNSDKPIDAFIQEQIAGDLIYSEDTNPTESHATGIIATGFLMLGAKMLSERDKEKLTMDVVDEQLDTIGKVFMGLSLGCARCHDHKFDPIPTQDYYALAGIFKSSETLKGEIIKYVSDWVRADLPVSEQRKTEFATYQKQTQSFKNQIKKLKDSIATLKSKTPKNYLGIIVDDQAAKKVGNWKSSTLTPRYVGKGYIHDDRKAKGEKSVTFIPKIPEAGRYEIRISYTNGSSRANNVPVTITHADGIHKTHLNQVPLPKYDQLFEPVGEFQFRKGQKGSIKISTENTVGFVIVDAVQLIPVKLLTKSKSESKKKLISEKKPKPNQVKLTNLQKELQGMEAQLKKLEKNAPKALPKALAIVEAKAIEDCQVRIRGESHNRGKRIPRGFIKVLSSDDQSALLPQTEKSGRSEFAQWLTRKDHPLTARVYVNRIWQHLMGEGIVRTVDNFGKLGTPPSHPDLLDHLAQEFMAGAWSTKNLIRRIVKSKAYRLSSHGQSKAQVIDPENRFLWRAHRKVLTAESIRDSMLLLSGQLDLTPSKEPVKTFKQLAVDNNNGSWSGKLDPSFQFKRSIYQPVVRGAIPDFMTVFDFADPDMSAGKRPKTNVPAQALLLMNDPFVIDCAHRFSKKFAPNTASILYAYLSVFGRNPSPQELRRAENFLGTTSMRSKNWSRFIHALMASTEFRMLD